MDYSHIIAPHNSQGLPQSLRDGLDHLDATYSAVLAAAVRTENQKLVPDLDRARRVAHIWYDEEHTKVLAGFTDGIDQLDFDPEAVAAAQEDAIAEATARVEELSVPRQRSVTTMADVEMDDDFELF